MKTMQALTENTDNLPQEVEYYASLMFTRREIAVILEIDEKAFIRELAEERESPLSRAFLRGRLKKEAEVRKSIFDLARNGSSPAQASAVKLIENAKLDDL